MIAIEGIGHRSMAWPQPNDVAVRIQHAQTLGPCVLKGKDKSSYDSKDDWREILCMGSKPHSAWRQAFIQRTKLAREQSNLTQVEICKILGIDQGRYKQYETRTPLPHEFIPAFCAATRITEEWLFNFPLERSNGTSKALPAPKKKLSASG